MLLHTLLLATGLALPAGDGLDPRRDAPRVTAHRITAAQGAPTIDGRLDDAVWAAADSIHGLVQTEPEAGKPARFPTVARIAVDDGAVYVAIRAYDPQPHRIAAQLTRRDEESPSDWLFVGIDSRHDLRTAYVFAVNPLGVKRDYIMGEGGETTGWDAVWTVATQRDSLGWTAEYRIPLSVLRYAPDGEGVWGLQITRLVQRERELSRWGPTPQDEPRRVARFGKLEGMRGLPSPRRLELLPYTVSSVTRAPRTEANAGSPFYRRDDPHLAAGVDVKYGVTSDLTLDATLNPDFGQVEADPSQVNLGAFETFVSERRPFFTEGADIFRFGIALGDGDNATESLFYSRRVGRAPQGFASGRWVDAPRQTTILGAAKLSGRVGGAWSVGAMSAVTGQEVALVSDSLGVRPAEVTVEPRTSYSVLRVRRDLNAGRTQIGGVATGVLRDLAGTDLDWLRSSAFAGGVDFSHRWGDDQWLASGFLLGSTVRGSSDAILRAQRSPARYFQRPDAEHVRLDSAATSLEGWSANYMAGKISGRWRGGVLGQLRSPGFEVNDLGFQRDADNMVNAAFFGFREFRPGPVFRNYGINTNLYTANNFGWERLGSGVNANGNAQLRNYWNLYAGVEHGIRGLGTTSLRGGPALVNPARTGGWLGFGSDGRKPFTGGLSANWGVEHAVDSWSLRIGPNGRWRVSSSANVQLSPFYAVNRDAWQYIAQPLDAGGERRYLFGELDQRTVGASLRVNQTFSPTLSLQLYAQPFVSAGEFGAIREVADPRAADFERRFRTFDEAAVTRTETGYAVDRDGDGAADLRFRNPEFNVRDFNLNAVLRWEYRMGSTFFLAWSHGRSHFDPQGSFRPRRDFDALFAQPSTNVLMIKANWWLNR